MFEKRDSRFETQINKSSSGVAKAGNNEKSRKKEINNKGAGRTDDEVDHIVVSKFQEQIKFKDQQISDK